MYFTDLSAKYYKHLFLISRSRPDIDLKFSPVVGADDIKRYEKFQVSHLFSWYFTDRSVSYLYCLFSQQLWSNIVEILDTDTFLEDKLNSRKKIQNYMTKVHFTDQVWRMIGWVCKVHGDYVILHFLVKFNSTL